MANLMSQIETAVLGVISCYKYGDIIPQNTGLNIILFIYIEYKCNKLRVLLPVLAKRMLFES